MLSYRSVTLGSSAILLVGTTALGLGNTDRKEQTARPTSEMKEASPVAVDKAAAMDQFRAVNPGADFTFATGPGSLRIERVYGTTFSTGASPAESAERFRTQRANMFGVNAEDLVPAGTFDATGSPIPQHLQPIMYNPETGQYKFTGVYYQQGRDGVPVFRSRLMVLTRNEANYPAVLASCDVRDIGTFRVTANAQVNEGKALAALRNMAPPDAEVTGPNLVIWAGYDNVPAPPEGAALALQYIVDAPNPTGEGPWRMLYLLDAASGGLLYQENQVHDVDISGSVKGNATSNWAAWNCSTPVNTNIPYARVTNGTNTTHCDANGNYALANAGATPVNVTASLQNSNFVTQNVAAGSAVPSMTQLVTPPGPGNFLFNPSSTEQDTALVNCFIHAVAVRNMALTYNPSYPTVSTQTNFPIRVNIGSTCNAYYTASTINFYLSGGGCANTGYSSVAYHEYGHNLIEKAGSGQGAYGEGQSDVMSVLMQDTPCLGDGFQSCGLCLRNAVNGCNFDPSNCSTCGSAIHTCGTILSGSVWNIRNNLAATHPATYRQILSNLAVNAMLLHTGTSITNSICIDYLTLDDNDGEITNGTPHYNQINSGFVAKGFAGQPLSGILFSYPNGKPSYVSPSGGTVMRVNTTTGSATPQPGTGKLFVSTGGTFTQYDMTQVSPNVYDAVFPQVPCGSNVRFYVSAQSTGGGTFTSPPNAPTGTFSATGGTGAGAVVLSDNFQTNLGWTVTNSTGLTAGGWERATPRTDCNRGNPLADGDSSGMCYLTQNANGPVGDICNSDIDAGSTTLTSPVMDASQASTITYWRWYSNTFGAAPQADTMVVEISSNNGAIWTNLETVGPTTSSANPEVNGGWFQKTFSLSAIPGFALTNQFRIRFTASDLGTGSVVEAGIDGVKLQRIDCANPCPADVSGDGQVNVSDLLAVINAWGPCAGCAADVNGDGLVNVSDLLAVINAWGTCP